MRGPNNFFEIDIYIFSMSRYIVRVIVMYILKFDFQEFLLFWFLCWREFERWWYSGMAIFLCCTVAQTLYIYAYFSLFHMIFASLWRLLLPLLPSIELVSFYHHYYHCPATHFYYFLIIYLILKLNKRVALCRFTKDKIHFFLIFKSLLWEKVLFLFRIWLKLESIMPTKFTDFKSLRLNFDYFNKYKNFFFNCINYSKLCLVIFFLKIYFKWFLKNFIYFW